MSRSKQVAGVALDAGKSFAGDDPFALAASLSYYTLLSMAPLLLIVTGFAGFLLGQEEVQRQLISQMRSLIGDEGASLMRTVIRNASRPEQGIWSMILGVGLMILGATTVFAQLQNALNRILGVEAAPANALLGFLWARLVAFGIVLALGFLLLVSLILSAVMAALNTWLATNLPGVPLIWQILNEAVSLAVIAVLIATLFRFVPDAHVTWRASWVGAFVTAALFTVGKVLIGLYLGQASVGSAYGAAGSAVVLMVWVYYASLILFYGAEITKVVAHRMGVPIVPASYARPRGTSPD